MHAMLPLTPMEYECGCWCVCEEKEKATMYTVGVSILWPDRLLPLGLGAKRNGFYSTTNLRTSLIFLFNSSSRLSAFALNFFYPTTNHPTSTSLFFALSKLFFFLFSLPKP